MPNSNEDILVEQSITGLSGIQEEIDKLYPKAEENLIEFEKEK